MLLLYLVLFILHNSKRASSKENPSFEPHKEGGGLQNSRQAVPNEVKHGEGGQDDERRTVGRLFSSGSMPEHISREKMREFGGCFFGGQVPTHFSNMVPEVVRLKILDRS